jgi:hypothetical protein
MRFNPVLNIMPDDKFIDAYIEMSERYIPNQSSYIIFGNREMEFLQKVGLFFLSRFIN